jgi:hypothetical protein
MYFLNQRIYVFIAKLLIVSHLTVRTKIAYAFAEWNVNVKTEIIALRKRKNLIVFILKGKGLEGSCKPASGKTCYNAHIAS